MNPAPATAARLSSRQKWRLAFTLALLYLPILLYLDDWYHSWRAVWYSLPLLLAVLGVGITLLFGWLHTAEWLQGKLFRWFGEDFLLELKLPALLLTLLFSLALALAFLFSLGMVVSLLLVLSSVVGLLGHLIGPGPMPSADFLALFKRANESFFLQLMLSTFYLLATSQALLRVRVSRRRAEQLETESLQAQLAALKNQVNPHFLFNSLSILSSLVHLDADLSERFIDQLALAYRYTLEQRDHDLVPLATELEFIRAYAFLLKIRFEEQFVLEIAVPEAARQHRQIAPLTLQLLVENTVKHNQMSTERPLRVHIGWEGDELVVRNTLRRRPAPSVASTGVGLRNIRSRYQLLTTRPVRLAEEAGEFVVRIPLLP